MIDWTAAHDWTASVPLARLTDSDLNQLFDNLKPDFQSLANTLSTGVLASYLLGYDYAREEALVIITKGEPPASAGGFTLAEDDLSEPRAVATGFQLAEDDDKKKPSKKPVKIPKWRIETYDPNEKDQVATEITDGKTTFESLRFDVPPKEAIDFFKRKKVVSADDFKRLTAEAKSGAFAIANVYQTDVSNALLNELIDALETGRTQDQVIARLKGILAGAGHKELGTAHLETVFRTTTQMAYGIGRRIAQEEAAEYLPVWEYSAVGDDRTRPTHMALDGLQYPVNHIFWSKYYPPWDFRCRCTVIPVADYRTGYDRSRPNDRSTITKFDRDGLPENFVADGQVKLDFTKRNDFVGVQQQTNLEATLKDAAKRALDSKKK